VYNLKLFVTDLKLMSSSQISVIVPNWCHYRIISNYSRFDLECDIF